MAVKRCSISGLHLQNRLKLGLLVKGCICILLGMNNRVRLLTARPFSQNAFREFIIKSAQLKT